MNFGDAIVIDVETAKDPKEVGWATSGLGVGCAVVYDCRRDRFTVYDGGQVGELQARIAAAGLIAGFNIWAFDLPVIYGVNRKDWDIRDEGRAVSYHSQALDLLRHSLIFDLRRLLLIGLGMNPAGGSAGGTNLDEVARSTLGDRCRKSMDSALLPGMLQGGRLAEVYTECANHVALERDLARFALRYGYMLTGERADGERLYSKLSLDSELWAYYPGRDGIAAAMRFGAMGALLGG